VAKRIEVQIVGDASSLRNALNQAQGSTSKFGSALGTLAKTGALAAGAAGIGAVALTLRQGIKEYTESAKVAAQTNAVLKSTGQAANVTAREISGLATSLMKKSGVDDEAIQSGENLLLTFTRIRNEAGKGNDIFNQATKATLDLSVAMGKDMSSSAILVGKALNDPVKGMTALTKAGVQFTDSQKETIKKMVETGDVMGAQKLILEELTKQFGGSAEAVGKTLPGQLNILKESFNNFAGDLVAKAIPSVQRFVDFLNTRLIPAEGFTATLKVAWEGVSEVAVDLWGQLKTAWEGEDQRIFIDAEKRMEIIHVEGLKDKLKASIMEQINTIDWSDVLVAVGVGIGKGTLKLQAAIWQFLSGAWLWAWSQIISTVVSTVPQFVSAVIAGVVPLQNRFRQAVVSAMTAGVAAIAGAAAGAYSAAMNLGSRIVLGLINGLVSLANSLRGRLDDIPGIIRGLANPAAAAAGAIGRAIVDGIVSGASGLGSRLAGKLIGEAQAALSRVKGFLHIGSPSRMWAEEVGVPIAEGITLGAAHHLSQNLAPNLSSVIKTAMGNTSLDAAAAAGGTGVGVSLKGGIDEFLEDKLPDNLAQVLGLAFDQATANFSAAGLGVTWSGGPASIGPVGGYSGGPLLSPNSSVASTVIVNVPNYVGDKFELTDTIRSELTKIQNRGGLGIG
jgi:hypothetical protein